MELDRQVQTGCPEGWVEDVFEMDWKLSSSTLDQVWPSLQRRETFVDGQLFPFRVEFDSSEQSGPFSEGELSIHHGPLLSAHGRIGQVTDRYRSLDYFYGSYVLSFRAIRPVRLEFEREGEVLRLKLRSYVNPRIRGLYRWGLNIFWKFFGITFTFPQKSESQVA